MRVVASSATPPCARMALIDRMRCWFVPMRPVTPFMMMPRRIVSMSLPVADGVDDSGVVEVARTVVNRGVEDVRMQRSERQRVAVVARRLEHEANVLAMLAHARLRRREVAFEHHRALDIHSARMSGCHAHEIEE